MQVQVLTRSGSQASPAQQQYQQDIQQQQLLFDHRRQQEREIAKTVELVHNFVISTAQFLSRFSAQCDARLYHVGRALDRLETRTSLLEFKVHSVEGDGSRGGDGESDGSRSSASMARKGNRHDNSDSTSLSERGHRRRPRTPAHGGGPAIPRIEDKPSHPRRAAEGRERADREVRPRAERGEGRRRQDGLEPPPQSPPSMPALRSSRSAAPPPPPLMISDRARGPPAAVRRYPVPPPLPSVGGPTGLPAPPPPPPPPRERRGGPAPAPGTAPRGGSGATYMMRHHPRLRGYFELLTLRVPVAEVRERMRENGIDPAWLDTPDRVAPASLSDYLPDFAASEAEESAGAAAADAADEG